MRLGVLAIPAAVAAVDCPLGIHEERGPSQVVVELESVEIDPLYVRDSHEYELSGKIGDLLIKTNNLLVEALTGHSPLSAKHDHERLACLLSLTECRSIIGPPCWIGWLR